uniref:Structure-specific endonuclease subunit SLX4 n=1 Tax=Lygus hesperus TaxID=30085 RepID=A0A0A9XG58_LYGHE
MTLRHRLLVAEVCEALLELHLSEETPATKADILKEMEDRGTKPEVRRVFQSKRPTMAEFNTAFRFTETFGLVRPERTSSGKYVYSLEGRLKEVMNACRGDFDDVITDFAKKPWK